MKARRLDGVRLVIFDLDGTLIDSTEDIALSVNELLGELGREALPVATVRSYVGNGVRKLLERALGESSDDALDRAVSQYLPIYRRRLLDHTRPYPGVVEALAELESKLALAVLTNKPRRESLLVLEGLGLDGYFRSIHGGDSFEERKPHPMGVERILEELGRERDETLFVGDSDVDLETARRASVRSCLVTYGMGLHEARSYEPDLTVEDLGELVRAIRPHR